MLRDPAARCTCRAGRLLRYTFNSSDHAVEPSLNNFISGRRAENEIPPQLFANMTETSGGQLTKQNPPGRGRSAVDAVTQFVDENIRAIRYVLIGAGACGAALAIYSAGLVCAKRHCCIMLPLASGHAVF